MKHTQTGLQESPTTSMEMEMSIALKLIPTKVITGMIVTVIKKIILFASGIHHATMLLFNMLNIYLIMK
jgi:hypothetical protein